MPDRLLRRLREHHPRVWRSYVGVAAAGGLLLALALVAARTRLEATASRAEWVFTAWAALAFAYNIRGVLAAIVDELERRRLGENGEVAIVTEWSVRLNLAVALGQLCWLAIGVIALLTPSPIRAEITLATRLATPLALTAQGCFLWVAWGNTRYRRALIRYSRARKARGAIT